MCCCVLQYSLCNDPLIELSNPGASGSLFYVSSDDEFIIKTVQHKEAEFLQKLLPGYFMVRVTCLCLAFVFLLAYNAFEPFLFSCCGLCILSVMFGRDVFTHLICLYNNGLFCFASNSIYLFNLLLCHSNTNTYLLCFSNLYWNSCRKLIEYKRNNNNNNLLIH